MRLLNRLYQWDVMRANKVPFAWGVEARVPFLDKAFLDLVMNIDPAEKMVRAPRITSWDDLPVPASGMVCLVVCWLCGISARAG